MEIRLQKYLAEAGVASRRKSEELILNGNVSVNGEVVRTLGIKIDDEKDEVKVNNKPVKQQEKLVYLLLNKPEGYITAARDQFKRPCVTDLVKKVGVRVFPVGRLDYDTSGLLILTNDGDLTYKLTHPKFEIPKTYIAKLFGKLAVGDELKFKRGIMLDGKMTKPANIKLIEGGPKYYTYEITIKEGRNRQVRRMCEEVKHPVATLKRVKMGEIELGDLKKGSFRELTEKEINYLKSI